MTVRLELPLLERVDREATKVDLAALCGNVLKGLLWLLAGIPFVLGWSAGLLVKILTFTIASIILGFRKGFEPRGSD